VVRLVYIPTLIWVQALSVPSESVYERLGVAGAFIFLIVFLWREDRKQRIQAQRESEQRYESLVNKVTDISAKTADTLAHLEDTLNGAITNCPFSLTAARKPYHEAHD
jgi:hypothetical protein